MRLPNTVTPPMHSLSRPSACIAQNRIRLCAYLVLFVTRWCKLHPEGFVYRPALVTAAGYSSCNELTIGSYLVHHLHDNFGLADGKSVEVLSNCHSKLLLANLCFPLPAHHCGRVSADARVCKEGLIERGMECRRRV